MSSSISMLVRASVIIAVASSSLGSAHDGNYEEDFRFISYNDLMATGTDRFVDDEVSSYGQLLFDPDRDQLFVGARDHLFRLSLRSLKRLEKAIWTATPDKISLCQDKGQSEDDCGNHIKVLLSDGRTLFACGTNAFSPQCSSRKLDSIGYVLEMVNGVAKCPYNPGANITALMTNDGHYYVGTPTDFSGSDPAIYRATGGSTYESHVLRTNQYNAKWLSEPQFVGSFEDELFVYFVFRESAVEYMNCGKKIYSRIARVCKNDSGGDVLLKNNWTTFVKARLNCSISGDYPFYYDEVQGIQYLAEQQLLYAVFTTSRNGITGSAICVYNKSVIDEVFKGPFKYQEHPGNAWESRHVPYQPHIQCQKMEPKTQQYTESSRYQLMDKTIQSDYADPLHKVDLELYTHLAVAVIETKFSYAHVIFVSNEDGLIKKLSVVPNTNKACLVEMWKPELDNRISPLKIMKYFNQTNSLYIGTEHSVIKVSASRCGRHFTQNSCLGAQDPFCGWDKRREICAAIPNGPKAHWVQESPACPDTKTPLDGGWSAWSPWEQCLQKGDDFSEDVPEIAQDKCLCQTRTCNNPAPRNGGKSCIGISISVTNCTVNGGWTAWSGWSACSASCGVAVKWRRRACGAPAPQHGGRLCVGPDRTEIYCTQNPPCPSPVQPVREGGWSDWGTWSACSSQCGGGTRWRQRRCDSPPPDPGAPTCSGCDTMSEPCNQQSCESRRASTWTPWQYSQLNNLSDGGYTEKRYKFLCKAQSMDDIKLTLAKEEIRYCNASGTCSSSPMKNVLSNGWSPWGQWSSCSMECGGGYQTATRTCLKVPCQGSATMQRSCNTHSCIDGWGCWSEWSPCSITCGTGRTERRRSCLVPDGCKGESIQTTICEGPSCESLLGWSEWTLWSSCDSNNEQYRNRHCLLKNNFGDAEVCQGPDTETRLCNTDELSNEIYVLHTGQIAQTSTKTNESKSLSLGFVIGLVSIALLIGALLAVGPIVWFVRRRTPHIPSSPHYITKQNSYVSVPLKDVPKKRVPSFSGIRGTTSGLTLSKPNNINSERDASLDSLKLYPKSMAGDYESATVKRNSNATHNNANCRNNIDVDQDKFY